MTPSRQTSSIVIGIRPAAWLYLIPVLVFISFMIILIQAVHANGPIGLVNVDLWGQTPVGDFINANLVYVLLLILASIPIILTIDILQRRDRPLQERRAANLESQKMAVMRRQTRPLELIGDDHGPSSGEPH